MAKQNTAPTMKDVAKEAGVSLGTVSKVINGIPVGDEYRKKVEQAKTLAERIAKEPKGKNFDVSWAKDFDWRVVSPFVEFAWDTDESLFDEEGLPRVLQVRELLDNLSNGARPAKSRLADFKRLRGYKFKGEW